jgi:hypothetical protein
VRFPSSTERRRQTSLRPGWSREPTPPTAKALRSLPAHPFRFERTDDEPSREQSWRRAPRPVFAAAAFAPAI